jgi:lipoprotein-releasing system permease protein
MFGIALGVMVLITVLSVMNGFDDEIRHRVFSMTRQLYITRLEGNITHWQELQNKIAHYPNVIAAAPFIDGQALLSSDLGMSHPSVLVGIVPQDERNVSELASKMTHGKLTDLRPGKYAIVLGKTLAQNLGVTVGDAVLAMLPPTMVTPVGVYPPVRHFTVAGIFDVGTGFNFNNSLAFINLTDAQHLVQLGQSVQGIRVKVADVYQAPRLATQLQKLLGSAYAAHDWSQDYGEFFSVVRMEKTMMFFMLLLIVIVAAFNLVSTLVMVVNDKRADIAILRTFGVTPRTILRVFIWQGMIVGGIGTFFGLIGGVLLAANATAIVNFLEKLFHVQLISASAFLVDYLPSHILARDVIMICVVSLFMSLIATLYPAWSAARTHPAEALSYE